MFALPPALAALPAPLLDPIFLLRAFYLAASALILVIQTLPAFRNRFLAYGSRATKPTAPRTSATRRGAAATKPLIDSKPPATPLPARPPPSASARLLDWAATLQVPHNYFTHFYLLSVACSLFWGRHWQLWNAQPQLQLVWLLMLLQGLRRMLESLTYTSTSESKMWIGHWLFGVTFYFTINIAVWAEGIDDSGTETQGWKTAALVPAILSAHALQHSYHAYLYRLRTENKDYQLPSHPLLPNLVCPHYTCEIAIYVLLSFLAAPSGRSVNWTLASGALLVMINLGVTAAGTKTWYEKKFGKEKVSGRKRMIPFIW